VGSGVLRPREYTLQLYLLVSPLGRGGGGELASDALCPPSTKNCHVPANGGAIRGIESRERGSVRT
jgi:hypothetical protein